MKKLLLVAVACMALLSASVHAHGDDEAGAFFGGMALGSVLGGGYYGPGYGYPYGYGYGPGWGYGSRLGYAY